MDSICARLRWVLSFLLIFVIFIFATSASAQGLFGGSLGLPSFGGFLGGSSGCGEKVCSSLTAPVLYVGWMGDSQGSNIITDTRDGFLAGLGSIEQHYPNRGLWLGLAESVCLNRYLSFTGSGWYLIPSNPKSSDEESGAFAPIDVSWRTGNQWWYVDGIFAASMPAGLTVLAGLRYEYSTTRFKNPAGPLVGNPAATGDFISKAWIPLIGTQYSCGNLVVRAIGFPAFPGNVRYNETDPFGAAFRSNAKGTWENGAFLEFFAEYSRTFGYGGIGIFGRWNYVEARSTVDFELLGGGGETNFNLTLHRYSWTLGGSFTLDFNLPTWRL